MNSNERFIDQKYDITGLEIKPRFHLQWYKDEDRYSDGDVEDVIIDLIIKNNPEDYTKVIYEHFSWPTYYHLTHIRKNLLNWYPFQPNASILEIGCGLGAITNLLCERCEKVTAVELSKRRATATLLRCRDKENLDVIVGNLNDIEFEDKFDYITLIGVLEYQGTYTDSESPFTDFLKKISSLLKPEGKLLIAIENKYGAKYWCGAREDHTGLPFDGLNQYKIGNGNARTFSKRELKELIQQSGLKNTYFYYPFPDYKLPTVVYSQDYLPKNESMQNMIPVYVPNGSSVVINEKGIYNDLIQNGVFEFFSNSYLVECSVSEKDEKRAVFASLSGERLKDYRIGTSIDSDKKVHKFALEDWTDACNHVKQVFGNYTALRSRGIHHAPSVLEGKILHIQYMEEPSLEEVILQKYKEKNLDQVLEYYLRWMKEIEKSSGHIPPSENIIYELELDHVQSGNDYGVILSMGYLDMIPRNCFLKDNEYWWFDQEWKLDKVPAKYVFYRGLSEVYLSHPWLEVIYPLQDIAAAFGLLPLCAVFRQLEEMFFATVMDGHHVTCARSFDGGSIGEIGEHITKLMRD